MHGNVRMCYLHFVHLHRWKKVMWEGAVAAFMSIQHGSGMCIKSALHSMARQSYQKSCSDNFFWPSIYTSQLQPGSKALAGALIAALLLGAIWWSHRFWNGSRQRRWFCWWLGQSPCVVQPPALQNDFVEVFAGDAAVTLACWNMGLVGSCHDVRYTSLMDMSTTHGFLLLNCKVVFNAQSWNNRATWSVLFSILEYVLIYIAS